MVGIAKMEKVSLKEVWKNEAKDFTSWLSENLDYLGEALGIELNPVETEKAVGPFYADILAEDENSHLVVVENQLKRTDHDHLGKILTYLINLEAKTAIWISSGIRTEHQNVINWLNESTSSDFSFYLVRVEAYRINKSPAAPLFSVITGPSEETKEIGQKKKDLAQRHYDRLEFWKQLIERSKSKTKLHAKRSPTKDYWLSAGSGKSGIVYQYLILKDESRIQLNIDRENEEGNKKIFDQLIKQKNDIDKKFGTQLNWRRLEGKKSSRITYSLGAGGLYDKGRWPEIQERMIDAMVRLHEAFKGPIKQLKI